jgi:hypothetical protein
MPVVFARGDRASFSFAGLASRLVGENVSISHRESDGPNNPRKIFQFVSGKNTAPGHFR